MYMSCKPQGSFQFLPCMYVCMWHLPDCKFCWFSLFVISCGAALESLDEPCYSAQESAISKHNVGPSIFKVIACLRFVRGYQQFSSVQFGNGVILHSFSSCACTE